MSEFDLYRVKGVIKEYPDKEIFIITGNLKAAKDYRERIREHTKTKNCIKLISNSPYSMDGLEFMDSIVFLCGYWWQNRNALKFMESFIKLPKLVIPITHIPAPDFFEGGEKVEQTEKE